MTNKTVFTKEFVEQVETKTDEKIAEIQKLEDPIARRDDYKVLKSGLEELYSEGKVVTTEGKGAGAGIGAFAGFLGAVGVGIAVFPPAAMLVPFAVIGAATAGGAAAGLGLGGLIGGRGERSRLRQEFGGVRNARKMHKLEKKVEDLLKEAEREVSLIDRNARLQQKFDAVFAPKQETPQTEAAPPAAVQPAQSMPEIDVPEHLIRRSQERRKALEESKAAETNAGPAPKRDVSDWSKISKLGR
jgi:hypothetical protein